MARSGAPKVRGLFTALITPFDEKGRVDAERLARLVEFQVSKGVDGIFPCGSTGLGPLLTVEERKLVAETVVKSAANRVPVVVQVGSADTPSTVTLARHAADTGAYAVASLTPYYYDPGERATLKHFEAILKAVEIPVFAYNIPRFTGINLAASAVRELARLGLAGIKDSSRDFLQLLDFVSTTPDDFVVMNGIEEYGLFAMVSGVDGLVSGGASALPELMKSMVAAQEKGDLEGALAAQRSVRQAKEVVKSGPIAAYYAILRARGVECGDPRRPILPMEKTEAERAVAGLRKLGLI